MNRALLRWILAGVVISALFWIDPLFIPLALLGPLVTGSVARSQPRRLNRRHWVSPRPPTLGVSGG
jgi:hypothetical protein